MARTATRIELATATAALGALRGALRDCNTRAHGSAADREVKSLRKVYDVASVAMGPLLSDCWTPDARSGTSEFNRMSRQVEQIVEQLASQAAYKGLRRSAMTVAQKTKFIEENGEAAYLDLPF